MGVLYDAETLDEIWPQQRPFGPYYWIDEDALRVDDRPVDAWRSPGADRTSPPGPQP